MPARVQDSKILQNLPKVSFRKIDDPNATKLVGVHDKQARSYGFCAPEEFERPEHYIRYIEPIESELSKRVEYDMDEQDKEWLDAVNTERAKIPINQVNYETFEIIMDRLEKEWFDLMKRVPKADANLPCEDSTCAICDDGEGENSNAIVFCDGCNLAVHQDCYGVPYIPEGQWLCRKCTVSPENPVTCILCPNEGGAFKQTATGKWAHLLCAIWIPEVTVGNQTFMEPVEQINMIPKNRWKLHCSLCKNRHGACIQCDNRSCFTAFHVTCARSAKLLAAMKSLPGSEDGHLRAYCEKHLPKEMQDLRASLPPPSSPTFSDGPKSSKTARAYAKTYRLGPPLVPNIIVENILAYIHKITIRQKIPFLLSVCKYWSLKREARRGAPLLKRLHLEPWTASGSTRQQTDEEKVRRLEHLTRLRKDLEHVRMLAELAKKREKEKLKQQQILYSVVTATLFPSQGMLRDALEGVIILDRVKNFFRDPVSKTDAPDYFDVVKKPMYWTKIADKLEDVAYLDTDAFKSDINLVFDNSMLYNQPGNNYYRAAERMKANSVPILDKVVPLLTAADQPQRTEDENIDHLPVIGDLEPPLPLLRLLRSTLDIQDSVDFVLESDPITSLFSFELEKPKPLPPPPPPRTKSKRPTKAELRARRAEREEQRLLDLLDEAPGFKGLRSRGAKDTEAQVDTEGLVDSSTTLDSTPVQGLQRLTEEEMAAALEFKRAKARESKKRRREMIEAELASIPLVVEPVDKRDTFKMFNQGWVLPSGTKRGGRAPVERGPPPVRSRPKKSTPSEQTQDSSGDTATMSNTGSNQLQPQVTTNTPHTPDMDYIPRRHHLLLEKTHKNDESSPLSPVAEVLPSPAQSSELSELAETPPGTTRPVAEKENGSEQNENFEEGGTLVWAKVESFPWFPAVIFEEDDDEVPDDILNLKHRVAGYTPGRLHLVKFYDNTWSWLPAGKLKLLGEDKELDQRMLQAKAKDKQKTARTKAFRLAMAEMETAEEAAS